MEKLFYFISKNTFRKVATIIFIVSITMLTGFVVGPFNFPKGTIVVIEEGSSIRSIASELEQKNIIRSSTFFTVLIKIGGDETKLKAGTYLFSHSQSVFEVLQRLINADSGLPLVKITIPEGTTVRDIAEIFSKSFTVFDAETFIREATPYEGYLFPETYYFTEGVSSSAIIATMKDQFDININSISEEINSFGKPLADVVVMASILEKEARTFETKQIIAGILWKRMQEDIPLQVDAVFGYIFNTDTFNPTFEQLKIDSPYNTYRNRGLPPGPIANPGLDSLRAAVTPSKSLYFYYLTGVDGVMHYGKTFDEHVANRRFLR